MKNKIWITTIFLIIFSLTIPLNIEVYSEDQQRMYLKIDLWSKELYVIEGEKVIKNYKISPGTDETPTPIGTFMIIKKDKEWGGGFGTRWLRLDVPWGNYGIHGTNKPWLMGKNISGGCIRMQNKDVEELFEIVSEGTVVHIEGPITGIGKGEFKPLSFGSKGTLVQIVQERLKLMSLYNGKVNGIYNKETQRAVELFQKENNLPITGGITKREYILLGLLE
ncbi:L,D-transpeptidase family protein [Fredinandcohnia sp. FSL W7-1320]|uniref:L,D-transpeptidase family protein n=1 Tax=Fredinandcohnia sp. FSL W7-1320 TaxID=2954540 RepID=UPI0030FD9F44